MWTVENKVLEIKCTNTLTLEHKLQLALYCYMIHHLKTGLARFVFDTCEVQRKEKLGAIMNSGDVEFILLSACTQEAYQMVYDDRLEGLVKRVILAYAKSDTGQDSDKSFIEQALSICRDPAGYIRSKLEPAE